MGYKKFSDEKFTDEQIQKVIEIGKQYGAEIDIIMGKLFGIYKEPDEMGRFTRLVSFVDLGFVVGVSGVNLEQNEIEPFIKEVINGKEIVEALNEVIK